MSSPLPVGLALAFALLAERAACRSSQPARDRARAIWASLAFGAAIVLVTRLIAGGWDVFPFGAACGFWLLFPRPTDSPRDVESLAPTVAWRAPLFSGVVTALLVFWTWGSLDAVPVSHDEAAYVLQARIFATGHWTEAGRPLPEFFEQTHVFVTPVLAAKYPPGHSLALVPGIWLGWPGLVPVLEYGAAGALVFFLARRLAGSRVAALTWLIWLTAPGALAYRASYFSQSTSTLLWLLGCWLLLRWRERSRDADLIALAACTGLLFLTRPLTMLAFSVPVGWIVLRDVIRRRAWRSFALSLAVGTLVLSVVPLWSYETLGDWRTTPYHRYSRVYYPYQWTGFTFDSTPALRPHPPEMEPFDRLFRRIQHEHRLSALPEILEARLTILVRDVWGSGRGFLYLFAVLGTLVASAETVFAVAGCGALVAAYLVFAHAPGWSIYYMEGYAALALVTAVGLWRVVSVLAERFAGSRGNVIRLRRLAFASVCVAGLAFPSLPQLWFARETVAKKLAYQSDFRRVLQAISGRKAIVFVRYAAGHDPHRELISNDPDLAESPAWIVYDRGPRNRELMSLAPQRAAYLYDESCRSLEPLIGNAANADCHPGPTGSYNRRP